MARLTLSEQVNALSSEKAGLQAQCNNLAQEVLRSEDRNVQLQAQLLDLDRYKQEVLNQKARIEELEKELKNAKSMREMYEKSSNKAESEIEQAHAVLDGVKGAPSREYDGSYGKMQRSVVTRLAGAFLVIAQNGV